MITHIQMEYMLAVAHTGNITKAAQLLHISQPSLSNQIIALEKQLGIPLLERRRKRVYLTDAGRYFAIQAQKILAQDRNLEYAMQEFAQLQNGSLRLGLLPILCPLQLPESIADFQRHYPQIRLTLTVDGSRQLQEKLITDDLDAIIAILQEKDQREDLVCLPFNTSSICAALHEQHPLTSFPALTLNQLTQETLILSNDSFVLQHIILESIKTTGQPPKSSMTCSQIESCLALADKNMGIAFCSPDVAAYYHFPHIVLRPIQPSITRSVYLVYRKNPLYFPVLNAFIQHIKTFIEKE
ncbi:LysR family transcriptional regulator [Acidaminococcus massiliensis]|uniref:LysR family transcriptional regulator n=1 Tax=Acidaminococcus massiliensis TaxID=1852375 RepID=UPI003520B8DA